MPDMRIKRAIAATALAVGFSVAGLGGGTASAQDECTVSDFTVDGVFDQEGYLACLSAAGATPGANGVLPVTGQNPLQAVGLAAGLFLVGGSLAVSAHRRKSTVA
jgi:hypothetical protein